MQTFLIVLSENEKITLDALQVHPLSDFSFLNTIFLLFLSIELFLTVANFTAITSSLVFACYLVVSLLLVFPR